MNNLEEYKGGVYVMQNESFPDVVKVGMTTGDPENRARQLGTGVPTPYQVLEFFKSTDPYALENYIHNALGEERVNPRREFFYAKDIENLLARIRELAKVNLDSLKPPPSNKCINTKQRQEVIVDNTDNTKHTKAKRKKLEELEEIYNPVTQAAWGHYYFGHMAGESLGEKELGVNESIRLKDSKVTEEQLFVISWLENVCVNTKNNVVYLRDTQLLFEMMGKKFDQEGYNDMWSLLKHLTDKSWKRDFSLSYEWSGGGGTIRGFLFSEYNLEESFTEAMKEGSHEEMLFDSPGYIVFGSQWIRNANLHYAPVPMNVLELVKDKKHLLPAVRYILDINLCLNAGNETLILFKDQIQEHREEAFELLKQTEVDLHPELEDKLLA